MQQLKKLFKMQQALDAHIEEKHQLQEEDLFNRKILALLVEIGELANEARSFKFWSVKPSSAKEVILEEFVDGIHFMLSVGIECGFHETPFELNKKPSSLNVTNQFLSIYELITIFQKSKGLQDYLAMFEAYSQLAELLGISNEEMVQAYIQKNDVNYQRQRQNY
ncbi:MAG TPA: dUTP diphosphatase [Neobacillus sp.]|jgi:dimeric dUTPase (all-alpha-NTP-PPase superfamily)